MTELPIRLHSWGSQSFNDRDEEDLPPRVAPFGNPGINGCQRLPRAYRSLATPFIAGASRGIHHRPLRPPLLEAQQDFKRTGITRISKFLSFERQFQKFLSFLLKSLSILKREFLLSRVKNLVNYSYTITMFTCRTVTCICIITINCDSV